MKCLKSRDLLRRAPDSDANRVRRRATCLYNKTKLSDELSAWETREADEPNAKCRIIHNLRPPIYAFQTKYHTYYLMAPSLLYLIDSVITIAEVVRI